MEIANLEMNAKIGNQQIKFWPIFKIIWKLIEEEKTYIINFFLNS